MSASRSIALLFPGQGSQTVGMGKGARDAFPAARSVFETADQALGFPLSAACFDGPEEALRLTATTQPAILTTSIALLQALRARVPDLDARVVCAAGHSLGEYSALVAAGAMPLDAAVKVVRRRGEYMQEAVPVGEGAMAAVLGAPLEAVETMCREAAEGQVLSPANLNAEDQTVVAGHTAAVRRLPPIARTHGARRVVELPVSAPFHCALMRPAQERLARDLATLPVAFARFPVVPNVTAEPEQDGERFRRLLEDQVTAPVRWVDTVRRIAALGTTTVVEIGPGKVLTGLAKRIVPEMRLLNVEDPASIEAAVASLGGVT
ncbi:MAG TPA: ACP S-malonyltransferase [Candidatus Polarisedimenticolia bacterium]|nr:ACP S-malonyltransferase [Candidatus Polarisedimenticolia bacterium]